MSDRLNIGAWRAWLDQDFRVPALGATLALRLAGVTPARHASDASRDAYSLEFAGPAQPVLPQGTYPFQHPELGECLVFIVPVGRNPEGVIYEAVFN